MNENKEAECVGIIYILLKEFDCCPSYLFWVCKERN